MKVYLTGSHSSGKSSLAKYISEKYKLNFISECARKILSEKELQVDSLRSNIDIVDDYQSEVFHRQLLEESKHTSFVSDRSAIDCLAYSSQHTRIFSKLINSLEFKNYLPTLQDKNSIIFFVRPCKATLKSDGVRETINWDAITAIDAQIKLLYEMFNIRYFQINTESIQERIKLITSVFSMR